MKKQTILALLMATLANIIAFSSCDSSSEVTTSDPSRDCVITSATLGTLRRTVSTKDTTYEYSVTGGAYLLYIDQVNYKVYNPDSLPIGTHTEKLVFASNGLVYSGNIAIKSLTSGQDTAFVPTDSTDFSVPREVTVYAEDGQSKRTYTFDIRVHKQEGDTIEWKQLTANPLSPLASFVKQKTLIVGTTLYVFGQRADGKCQVIETNVNTSDFNNAAYLNGSMSEAIDVKSVQYVGGSFYALAGNKLVKSQSATGHWEAQSMSYSIDALASASGDSLYAISDNQLLATADGTQWNISAMEQGDSLPTTNVMCAVQPAKNNHGIETTLLLGSNKGKMFVWKHDVSQVGGFVNPWISLPQTSELKDNGCPNLTSASLFAYDGNMVMAGVASDNTMTPFYVSQDNGRTWKTGLMYHPTITNATTISVACDNDGYLWIVCSGVGEVYKGRLNRLAWEQNQTRFE